MGNRLHNAKNYKTQFGCYIDNDGKLRLKLGEVENYKGIWSNGDEIFINDIVYIVDNNLRKYYIATHNLESSLESPLTDTNNFSEFFECPISSGGNDISVSNSTSGIENEVVLDLSNNVLSAHFKQSITNDISRMLKIPLSVSQNQLVSVNSSEQQIMLNIGDGLSLTDGVLSASGRGTQLYKHYIQLSNLETGNPIDFTLLTDTGVEATDMYKFCDIINNHQYSAIDDLGSCIFLFTGAYAEDRSWLAGGFIQAMPQVGNILYGSFTEVSIIVDSVTEV